MMDREVLVQKIKALSDSIRKKHADLKNSVSERERFLENTFNPVIAPLKEISKTLKYQPVSKIASENGILQNTMDEEDHALETENEAIESDSIEEEEEETTTNKADHSQYDAAPLQSLQDITSPSINHRLSILSDDIGSKGVLTRKYILKMLHGTHSNRKYHAYGARVEKDGIMIGDSPLITDDEDNIIIKRKSFKGTSGLFELIFKSSPQNYNARDLNTFKSILKLTSAHKKDYSMRANIYRNKSKKYNDIISKLFPPHRRGHLSTGKGISLKNSYETNVIYYKDINKLIDRMRLLYEAKQSGHTGVDNELIALTEEMRGRGYII